jgi:phage gp29-like protein
MEWRLDQGLHLPNDIEHRPQSWFMLDRDTRAQLLLRDTAQGTELRPFNWIIHTHRAKPGYLARSGLHRVLAWPYLFKNYSVRDLAELLEIYGLPIKVGTYPTSASEDEKTTLLRALVGIGHNAAGIIPEGMMIDFQQAAEGHDDLFKTMIDWCERTQSKAILGATLTSGTGEGTNTNALGNVHNEVRHDLRDSDASQIEGTLTRDLLYPMAAVNGRLSDPRRCPRFVFDTEEGEDFNLYSQALPKLVDVGFQIPVKWAQEKQLKIPLPEENEPILQRATPAISQPQPLKSEIPALLKTDSPPPDTADQYLERLQAETAKPVGNLISQIGAMLDQATSLEQFERDLLSSFGSLDPDELVAVMRMAFSAAELAGRFEVDGGE